MSRTTALSPLPSVLDTTNLTYGLAFHVSISHLAPPVALSQVVQSRVESVELLADARPATAASMMAGVYLILDDLRLLGDQRDVS
jgi:hypothetical protein